MMQDSVPATHIQQDLSVSITIILLHSIWMTVVFLIIPLIPFALIWGKDPLLAIFSDPNIIFPALVLVIAHELLHALGWKLAGKLSFLDFHFGIAWKTLSPYCHTWKPMTARAYRIGAVLPGITLGLLPILFATLTGDGFIAILGGILTAGAVGDIYVLWLLRNIPHSALVADHPTRAGCIVLDKESFSDR